MQGSGTKSGAARRLCVRMIGHKGLPGIHGGVDRHVEELGARLAARGHEVVAYCRPRYTPSAAPLRGIELRLLPTIHTKHLDASVHSFLASWHAAFAPADIVHYHGIGPAAFSFIPRLAGKKIVTTFHSRDYLRSKWGPFAQWALRQAERIALAASHAVICVNAEMARSFTHTGKVRLIPNGVSAPSNAPPGDLLAGFGLRGGDYLLYAGRISPEKGPHHLLRAFALVKTDLRLVLAGARSHNAAFEREVEALAQADPRVILAGHVDAERMPELYANARGFVLPSEHEGLPIALLEAMSYACPCACTDIAPAREVATGEDGGMLAFFAASHSPEDLAAAIDEMLRDERRAQDIGATAQAHVLSKYGWDDATHATEEVFTQVAAKAVSEEGPPCPICGETQVALEYPRTRSGRVVRCVSCGMVHSTGAPLEILPGAVTDDPEAYLENARDRLGRLAAFGVRPGASPAPRLLDIGCYDGHFAAAAARLGFDVMGVEPVAEAAQRARDRHGIKVVTGNFETAPLDAGAFDVVSFIHVFEHLKDPRATLRRARETLREGGLLLLEIPAYDACVRRLVGGRWRQFIADHDRFYTGPVLRALVESEGFRVLLDGKAGKVLTPRLLADRVARYYSAALGRLIAGGAGGLGISAARFRLNLGDIRILVARK